MYLRFCPPLLHLIRRCGAKVSAIERLFSFPPMIAILTIPSRPQEIITMPDANLTRSVMYLYDCFLDDYHDEKYVNALSPLNLRAQVEVSANYATTKKKEVCRSRKFSAAIKSARNK